MPKVFLCPDWLPFFHVVASCWPHVLNSSLPGLLLIGPLVADFPNSLIPVTFV